MVDTFLNFDVKDFMNLINEDCSRLHDIETEDKFLIVTMYKQFVEGFFADFKFTYKGYECSVGLDTVETFDVTITISSGNNGKFPGRIELCEMQKVFTEKTGFRFLSNNNSEYALISDPDAQSDYQKKNSMNADKFNDYKGKIAIYYNNYEVKETLSNLPD